MNKGKFASIQKGDILILAPENNVYTSFKEMVESEGIENVIPDKSDIDEATKVYYKFYTKELENEFGVLAIRIKKID